MGPEGVTTWTRARSCVNPLAGIAEGSFEVFFQDPRGGAAGNQLRIENISSNKAVEDGRNSEEDA